MKCSLVLTSVLAADIVGVYLKRFSTSHRPSSFCDMADRPSTREGNDQIDARRRDDRTRGTVS